MGAAHPLEPVNLRGRRKRAVRSFSYGPLPAVYRVEHLCSRAGCASDRQPGQASLGDVDAGADHRSLRRKATERVAQGRFVSSHDSWISLPTFTPAALETTPKSLCCDLSGRGRWTSLRGVSAPALPGAPLSVTACDLRRCSPLLSSCPGQPVTCVCELRISTDALGRQRWETHSMSFLAALWCHAGELAESLRGYRRQPSNGQRTLSGQLTPSEHWRVFRWFPRFECLSACSCSWRWPSAPSHCSRP